MNDQFRIRRMNKEEVDPIAVRWAAGEGWNPGLYDATCFFAADPEGFLVGEIDGAPAAVISAVAYDGKFGFMGFYIVKPEFRGKGYGMQIFRAAMDRMGERNIGGDGVMERIKDYETQGFKAYYKNRRYQGAGLGGRPVKDLILVQDVPFERLAAFDDGIFPARRHQFLKCWISRPGTKGYAVTQYGKVAGYGVVRPCFKGYKIGPLFADNVFIAEKIFNALRQDVPKDQEFFFDTPEINPQAVQLAEKNKMKVVFETARIYTRSAPLIPLNKVFGVTSFELG